MQYRPMHLEPGDDVIDRTAAELDSLRLACQTAEQRRERICRWAERFYLAVCVVSVALAAVCVYLGSR